MEILLAGESWITIEHHFKGWDHFTSATFHDGASAFKKAMEKHGIQIHHLYAHLVPDYFPRNLEELTQYDVIILSDIGSNSLLLPSETWLKGKQTFNRLELLRDYVKRGGGLVMVGGYYSFQGIHAMARYRSTPIEEILPVRLLPYDDRVEAPEGLLPTIGPHFSAFQGFPSSLPALLGYNKVILRNDSACIYLIADDPLLALREVGKGRTAAWMSDIGPHWCPHEFMLSKNYEQMWVKILQWVGKKEGK
jgi:uncharacterized membrane protein